jgi:hypothetical protein
MSTEYDQPAYGRAGANDEARIYFNEALKRLTFGGNARANAADRSIVR